MKALKTRRSQVITHTAGKTARDFAAVASARPVRDVDIREPICVPAGALIRTIAEAARA